MNPVPTSTYRVGGIAAVALGVAYVVVIPLYAHVGAPPTGGTAWLQYLQGKTTVWWVILGLSVATDLLYIPVTLALYRALHGVSRDLTTVAAALVASFIVLDLAVTWTNYAALISLSTTYAAATDPMQRAADVAAANYASAVLSSSLEVVYAIVILSAGVLLIGLVMLRGPFGRVAALLALATGVLGIASLAGYGVTVILNALFATAWLLVVGYKLCRLSAHRPELASTDRARSVQLSGDGR